MAEGRVWPANVPRDRSMPCSYHTKWENHEACAQNQNTLFCFGRVVFPPDFKQTWWSIRFCSYSYFGPGTRLLAIHTISRPPRLISDSTEQGVLGYIPRRSFYSRPPKLDPGSVHQIRSTSTSSLSVPLLPLPLKHMAQTHNVTPATILYYSTAVVHGSHTGCENIVFGLTLSDRDAPVSRIDKMIDPAICTLPFRCQVSPGMSLSRYLKYIQNQVLKIIPHQQHGLHNIKRTGMGAKNACNFRCLVVMQPGAETTTDERLVDGKDVRAAGTSVVLARIFSWSGLSRIANCCHCLTRRETMKSLNS